MRSDSCITARGKLRLLFSITKFVKTVYGGQWSLEFPRDEELRLKDTVRGHFFRNRNDHRFTPRCGYYFLLSQVLKTAMSADSSESTLHFNIWRGIPPDLYVLCRLRVYSFLPIPAAVGEPPDIGSQWECTAVAWSRYNRWPTHLGVESFCLENQP